LLPGLLLALLHIRLLDHHRLGDVLHRTTGLQVLVHLLAVNRTGEARTCRPSDNSATPTTSVTRLMRGPPCGCTQFSCANAAASGDPAGSIPTVLRQGKLRRSGAPRAGPFSAPAHGLDTPPPHGVHGSGCGRGLWWCWSGWPWSPPTGRQSSGGSTS